MNSAYNLTQQCSELSIESFIHYATIQRQSIVVVYGLVKLFLLVKHKYTAIH
jgi:hypothetical protein